jgi:small subunit ribosomal protein S20
VANIKSQIKRNRQNDKRRLRNRVYRGTARIAVRSARTAIETGVPESTAALTSAISALDKAVEQGVLHKNNAARRKSRLMKAFAKMEPVAVTAEAAMVEPVLEPEVKKAASRRRGAKAEVVAEPLAETKKAPAKKTAAKKPVAKKTSSTTKKPAAK